MMRYALLAIVLSALLPFAATRAETGIAPAEAETAAAARSSQIVGQDEFEDRLREALAEEGAGGRLDLRFNQRYLEVPVAGTAPVTIELRDLRYDRRSGRFDALFVVAAGDDDPGRPVRITGHAYALLDVPVPSRTLRPGTVIAANDLDWIEMRENQVDRRTALQVEEIIGLSPRRSLPEGAPVRVNDLEPPLLVGKGKVVTMIYETSNMRLTAIGRALEDGAQGNFVRVLNLQSNTVVQGVAVAENVVTLPNPANAVAMSEWSAP